jgi:guanylate kinase
MNELTHIAEFRALLANYKLSDSAKNILEQTKLVLLVGPTSSGRNTIITELVRTGDFHYIVSDTTRQPRTKDGIVIEENGREYWFRDEDELLEDIRNGEFLEAAIIHNQQVSGVSIREIKAAHQAEQIAITDIEPSGATTIHTLKPDVVIIFILPPNFAIWLQRFLGRSDLPDDEVRRRLITACSEIEEALDREYYRLVVNDNYLHAAAEIKEMIEDVDLSAEQQAEARAIAVQLLEDTRNYLS